MAEVERYDEVLMTIAGQCGGIQPLLDVFFSFLYRRTDFFHIMQSGDAMGFADGVAEKLLLQRFKQYQQMAERAREQLSKAKLPPQLKGAARGSKGDARSDADKRSEASKGADSTARSEMDAVPPAKPAVDAVGSSTAALAEFAAAPSAAATAASREPHFSSNVSTPYNGGLTEKYAWEQTLSDVTIQVPVPAGTKARDVICVIGKSRLKLKLRGEEHPLLDNCYPCDARNGKEVWEKVRADECTWSLDAAKPEDPRVCIYLEKDRESWWKSALHGDAEIDTTKVDSTRSMYEYDGETQGAIRKIMFDQDQQRKGLPTSDALQNEEMLRKAWDAEGSPFKGTPFNPSAINFEGGAPGGMPQLHREE